jgi:hypothetical protein
MTAKVGRDDHGEDDQEVSQQDDPGELSGLEGEIVQRLTQPVGAEPCLLALVQGHRRGIGKRVSIRNLASPVNVLTGFQVPPDIGVVQGVAHIDGHEVREKQQGENDGCHVADDSVLTACFFHKRHRTE